MTTICTWRETDKNIWQAQLGDGVFKLAVFRPTYDRSRWYFAINGQDAPCPFNSKEAAQFAAITEVEERIERFAKQLIAAKDDAKRLREQQQDKEKAQAAR